MMLALQRNEFKSCSFDNDSEDESIVEEDHDFKGELLGNEEEFDTEEESIRRKSLTMVFIRTRMSQTWTQIDVLNISSGVGIQNLYFSTEGPF